MTVLKPEVATPAAVGVRREQTPAPAVESTSPATAPPRETQVQQQWWEVVPWAALGIFASLLWNYFNYRRTTGLQARIRQDTVRLEEFRRVRTPIDAAVSGVRSQRNNLAAYLRTGDYSLAGLKLKAKETEKALTEAYVELSDALLAANTSAFAVGEDWLTAAEENWDAYATAFNSFHAETDEPSSRLHLKCAIDHLDTMLRALSERIDQELIAYVGSRKATASFSWRAAKPRPKRP